MSQTEQMAIDFEVDETSHRLETEIAVMLIPHLKDGLSRYAAKNLAARIIELVDVRREFRETREKIRCHTCDRETGPKERARIVVCVRCALEGRSPGSRG